jgi:hypothetical protein
MKNQLSAESTDDFLPPKLNSVGHKLRTAWLNEVLVRQGRSRPWMAIRMPNYAEPHLDQLAKDFAKIEGTIPDDAIATVEATPEKIEAGRTLAGKTANGFGCISCHDISGIRGGGTRGPDLATIHQRLRIDWYTLWMHQPQRLSPGTKMPQNFLDGKSPLTAILKGDANAQIEAMWAYFSQGPGLPLPEGIEPPNHGIIIPVKDRPEILRTFLPEGAGTRPVAVGYPGGVNIAFDTATCRLAYAWAGPFLDASPVWTNRGGRPAIVLGTKFWSAPSGHPWFLTDGEPPRPKGRDTDPAYGAQLPDDALATGPRYVRFRGYTLDEQGYPTFRYSLADSEHHSNHLEISETPRANMSAYASGWRRRFQVQVPQPRTAWFLVATSTDRIRITPQRAFVPQAAGGWHVYELSNTAKWSAVADADNSQRLFFQLPSGRHDMTLKLWSVPTSNEEILRMLK